MNRSLRIALRFVTNPGSSLREIRRRLADPQNASAAGSPAASDLTVYGLRGRLGHALTRIESLSAENERLRALPQPSVPHVAEDRSEILATYGLRSRLGNALARVEALSAENERLKALPLAPVAFEEVAIQIKALATLATSCLRDELRQAEWGSAELTRRYDDNVQSYGSIIAGDPADQSEAIAALRRRLEADRTGYDALAASIMALRRQVALELDQLGARGAGAGSAAALYLDLMEGLLTGELYGDPPSDPWSSATYDPVRRLVGRDWPRSALTMIGTSRMRNLRTLCERALAEGVAGDFIETGVWRGGACIYMRAILKAHGDVARRVFVADSFAGLPPPDPEVFPADEGDTHHVHDQLAISRADVEAGFSRFGLLDGQVVVLEGWFKDTLPTAPIERLAVLRLDGDMYESTWQALEALYDKVSPGGYVIVDDYILKPCSLAIDDFRRARGIEAPLEEVDGAAVWWRVGQPAS